jgi:hypothetical protein
MRNKIVITLATVLFITCSFPFYVFADSKESKTEVITETFLTNESKSPYGYEPIEKRVIGGKEYKLKNVSYRELKIEPIIETKVETIENLYTPNATFDEKLSVQTTKGKTNVYSLESVKYEPQTIKNRTQFVKKEEISGFIPFYLYADKKREIEIVDDVTKEKVKSTIPLSNVKMLDEWEWRNIYSSELEVEIYNASLYILGDKFIKYNAEKPNVQGNEEALLNIMQLNTESNRVVNSEWVGEIYEKDGKQYRKAKVEIETYCANFQSDYLGTVKLNDYEGYKAIAKYQYIDHSMDNMKKIEVKLTYAPYNIIPVVVAVVGGGSVVIIPLMWFFIKSTRVKFYYGKKYIGKVRIVKGSVDVTHIKRKVNNESVKAIVSKQYARQHNAHVLLFVQDGEFIKRYLIPTEHKKQTIIL